MQCPKCGHELPPDVTTCAQCAVPNMPPPPIFAAGATDQLAGPPTPHGMATAALVLGFCSLIFSVLTAVPAVVLGIVALWQIKGSRGTLTGGSTAITGIVAGCLLVMVNAALFFPVFSGGGHEKGRQALCMDNQKQLVTGLILYVQDHGESLPPVKEGAMFDAIDVEPGVLHCPSWPKGPIGYVYNAPDLANADGSGKKLGEVEVTSATGGRLDSAAIFVTMDGQNDAGNPNPADKWYNNGVYRNPSHADFTRHKGVAVKSFLDGHAAVVKE